MDFGATLQWRVWHDRSALSSPRDRKCHCRNCTFPSRAFTSRPYASTTPRSSVACARAFKGTDARVRADRVCDRAHLRAVQDAAALPRAGRARGHHRRLRGRGREACLEVNERLAGRGGPGDLRRHRAPVLRAGDRDGGRGQAGPQAHARVRRDRGVRRAPGGDPDRGRLPGPARQLPHRAGLHVRAVGPVSELRHPDRPRPGAEDRRPDDRQCGGLRAAAPQAVPGRRHPPARRSTRSPRPTTGTCVRSRSTARWCRRPSS